MYEDLSDKLDYTGVVDLKTSPLSSSLSIDLNGSPPSSAGVGQAGSQVRAYMEGGDIGLFITLVPKVLQ